MSARRTLPALLASLLGAAPLVVLGPAAPALAVQTVVCPTATVNAAGQSAVTISGTDSGPGFVTVSATDGSTTVEADPVFTASGSFSVPIDLTALLDGTVTVTAESAVIPAPKSCVLTKDSTVPSVAGLALAPTTLSAATDDSLVVSGVVRRTVGGSTPSESGTSVVVTLPASAATVSRTVPTASDGAFVAALDASGVPDGAFTVNATPVDPAGNTGAVTSVGGTKDATAPAAPVVASLGDVVPGSLTAASVAGTAEAGSAVVVTVTDATGRPLTLPPVTATGGTFTTTYDATSFADGPLRASAVTTDVAGNPSARSAERSATKDTTALALLSITPDEGDLIPPGTAFSATLNEPVDPAQSSLVLRDAGAVVVPGTGAVSPDGRTVSFTPAAALADGVYTATLTAVEAAPLSGAGGAADPTVAGTISFEVDGTVPAPPLLDALPATVGAAAQLTVSGTAEPATTLTVNAVEGDGTVPGATLLTRTLQVPASGAFSTVLDLATFDDGLVTVTAVTFDGLQASAGSTPRSTRLDTVLPAQPAASATDVTQAATSTVVGGTAEPGSTVTATVTRSGSGLTLADSAVADGAGAWSVSIPLDGVSDGSFTVTVVARDAAANASPPRVLSALKDATGPTLSGVGASTATALSPRTSVTGTTEPGAVVAVRVSDGTSAAVGSATAAAGGAFAVPVDLSALEDGTLAVTVSGTDARANAGPVVTVSVIKDTVGPLVTDLAATASDASAPATTVTGRSEPGARVALRLTASGGAPVLTRTVTAAPDGTFTASVDLSSMGSGTVALVATGTDAVGNAGPAATASTSRDGRPATPVAAFARAGDAAVRLVFGGRPFANGAPLTRYEVLVSPTGTLLTVNPAETSLLLTGLSNGTAYSFQMRAVTARGASAFGAASNVATPRFATLLTLGAAPSPVVAGQPLTLSGTLTRRASGVPLGNFRVVVQARADDGSVRTVGAVATNRSGRWSLRTTPLANAVYTASYAGRQQDAPATSVGRRVLAATRLTLNASSGPASAPLALSGSTGPRKPGAVVTVLRVLDGRETRVASATVGSDGVWRTSVRLRPGSYVLVARIGPTRGNTSGVSARVSVTRR